MNSVDVGRLHEPREAILEMSLGQTVLMGAAVLKVEASVIQWLGSQGWWNPRVKPTLTKAGAVGSGSPKRKLATFVSRGRGLTAQPKSREPE